MSYVSEEYDQDIHITLMPENEYNIPEGNYTRSQVVILLREFKDNPNAIQFIADMLE